MLNLHSSFFNAHAAIDACYSTQQLSAEAISHATSEGFALKDYSEVYEDIKVNSCFARASYRFKSDFHGFQALAAQGKLFSVDANRKVFLFDHV